LTSDNWYNYSHPVFTWTGASDESGIAGYWVYFGTSSTADPKISGAFQTSNSLSVSSSMEPGSTYYLRIKAVDNAGNVASTAYQGFIYKYDTAAPDAPSNITADPAGCPSSDPFDITWDPVVDPNSGTAGYQYKNGPDGEIQETLNTTATVSHCAEGGNIFYVRTKDNAGNVSGWANGVYCYLTIADTEDPTNPTTIMAFNQEGGSVSLTTNTWYNYSAPYFSWSGASDNVGVAGYYVYFGIDSGFDPASSEDYYQTATTYTGSATNSGQNYFLRIKTKDLAGNVTDEAWAAFIYKYSTEIPTNPTDLTALSTAGGSELTTDTWYNYPNPYFEWSGAGGGQGAAGYWVYLGTNDSAEPETSGNYQTSTNFSPIGLVSGENYYLRIKTKDIAGNPASEVWAPFIYKYDATPPSPPEYINVSPLGCSTSPTFTLTWAATDDSESGLDKYEYKKGSAGAVQSTTDTSKTITPYQEEENIFYVRAKDNAGNNSSWQTTTFCSVGIVHIIGDPTPESGPSSLSVKWASDKPSTSFVQVYEGNTYVSEQGHTQYTTSHSVTIVGLKSETDYRFQLVWSDQSGNLGQSEFYGVATASTPQVKNLKVEPLSPVRAIVSWETNYTASSVMEFGMGGYHQRISMPGEGNTFSREISDLTPAGNYQLRIKAETLDKTEFSSGLTFTMPPYPEISTMAFEQITTGANPSVKVSWTTNIETTTQLFWALLDQPKKEISSGEFTTEHSVILENLQDTAVYQVYAQGMDRYGNITKSDERTFNTPIDTRPPKIISISIQISNIGTIKKETSQATVSWVTDEPATSLVQYAEGTGGDFVYSSAEDEALTINHTVTIDNLKPSIPYQIRAVSRDKADNTVNSDTKIVVTGKVQKTALTVILQVLTKIFGWAGKLIQ